MLGEQIYYPDAEFVEGDVVEVSRRMWPGMNKQGGIAKITGIHRDNDSDSFLYDVKYVVVNGGENKVNPIYITRKDNLSKSKRETKGRCSFCKSLIIDCKHDQTALSDPNIEQILSQHSVNEMVDDEDGYAVDESLDSDDSTINSEASLQLTAQGSSRGGNIINGSNRTQEIIPNSIEYSKGKENLSPYDSKKFVTHKISAIRSSDGILSRNEPDDLSEYQILIDELPTLFTPEIATEMLLQSIARAKKDIQAHDRILTTINNLKEIKFRNISKGSREQEELYYKIISLDNKKEKLFRVTERSAIVCFDRARIWFESFLARPSSSMKKQLERSIQLLEVWVLDMETIEANRIDVKKKIIELFKSIQDAFKKVFGVFPSDREYVDSTDNCDVDDNRPLISKPHVTVNAHSSSRARDREQDYGASKKVPKQSYYNDSKQDSRKRMKLDSDEEFNPETDRTVGAASHGNKTPRILKTFRVHGKPGKKIESTEDAVERVKDKRNSRFHCNKEVLRTLLPKNTSKPASVISVSTASASSTSFRSRNLRLVQPHDCFSHSDLGMLFKDFYNAENEEIPVDVSNPKESTLTYRINYMRALHHSTVRAYASTSVLTIPETDNRGVEAEISVAKWADSYIQNLWDSVPNNATGRQFILGLQPVLQESSLRICSYIDLIFSAIGSSADFVNWKTHIGEKIEKLIEVTMRSLQKVNCLCSQSAALLVLNTKDADVIGSFLSLLRSIDSNLLAKFHYVRNKIINACGSLHKNLAYDFSLFVYLSFNKQRSASIKATFSEVLKTMRAEKKRFKLQHEVSGPFIRADDCNFEETVRILFDEQKAILDSCVRFLLTNPRLLILVVTELNDVVLKDIGRLSDENNMSEFQTGKIRGALHLICSYQLILNELYSMHKEIRKDFPDKFKFWDLIEKAFSIVSSQSTQYSETWTRSQPITTGKALVGVPNPNICHEDSEKNSMCVRWEYLWRICSVTSYLLFSIRLNDSTEEVKRIENNHRIVRALCTFACDRVVSATSAGNISVYGDELKQLYISLYRLSNLAFVVDDTINLHYVSIYFNCVSNIACAVSQLPFKAPEDPERVDVHVAAKASKSVISLSFLAYYAGRNCSINPEGKTRVVSEMSWKESMDLIKNRLHQDLLAAVNSLFDHCNLLNPYRLHNRLEGPVRKRETLNVLENIDDIEKLRSILRNLLWNLTHTCSTTATGNFVVPHYTKEKKCIGQLEEIIFNKKDEILNIFKLFPSFTTGLLVSQILKELRLIGADFTDKELSLYTDLQTAFINCALVDEQCSCLLWFTAAIGANPYPVTEEEHKFCNTKDFIIEQKTDHQALIPLCDVIERTRLIFAGRFKLDTRDVDAIVKLSVQLMNTTISACSSLIRYQIQFLRKCSDTAVSKYRAVVLPKELLQKTLTVLVTSIGSAGFQLVTKYGVDSHLIPTIYLTTAIIEYLLGWVQYQIQLEESEKDSDSLGENKVHIMEVQENRGVDIAAVNSFFSLIEKQLFPSLKIIFSKASLHKMDCLKEDYQILTEFPQSTHSDVAYGPTSDIGNDKEILNRMKSSDCCVAVVKAYESFIRLRICTKGTLPEKNRSVNFLFESYYAVINTLQMKFASENTMVVSFSQCWYKILFLNPLFQLLYSYDSDASNRVIGSSPTVEACSRRLVSVVYTINASISSLLQSTNVFDYYKTFLMIALTEPIMPLVCSRIQFSRYCHNLLVFSCIIIESSAYCSPHVAAVLPYARLYVGSCLQHGMLVQDSSSWIAKSAESFLHHCIDSRDLHRVVKSEWKLNICDIFQRVIKFIHLRSFHVRMMNKKHYSDIIRKYKALCVVVVRKCRLSQIQRADDSSLIVNTDNDQLIYLFNDFIWGDTNELLKLLFVHKYLQLARTPMSWTVDKLTLELLGSDEDDIENHALEIDRQLRVLENLCHYIVLIFSVPYSTKCESWLCLLQLMLISAVNCPALEHAHSHGTVYTNATLALIHRLESACQDVDILWAAAVCPMPLEMEQHQRDPMSYERVEHILGEKLRGRFAFLQNASADRLKTICESVSAIARSRSCNYHADRSHNFNSTDSFRQQFSIYLLEDPSNVSWNKAQHLLLQSFDHVYSREEEFADKRRFLLQCVSWQRAKTTLVCNMSAMETVIKEAWTSYRSSSEGL